MNPRETSELVEVEEPLTLPTSLPMLERLVQRDLEILEYPQKAWMKPVKGPDGKDAYDVVVVGGGHCAISVSLGILQEKIFNILVLDENPEGEEGPWLTYARMPDLRTRKAVIGMEYGYSNLTFRAYFEAREGLEAYASMPRITCENWVAYMLWLRKILKIPFQNSTRVKSIEPTGKLFKLTIERSGKEEVIYCRRAVLATGPLAMGGPNIPEEVKDLPGWACAPAFERFDVDALKGKRIGIVGAGATAFDNAGELLERGVASVDMLIRKPKLDRLSVIRWTDWAGFLHTFADLSDKERWDMMRMVQRNPPPPTPRALVRIENNPNLHVHFSSPLVSSRTEGREVVIETAKGEHRVDFLILATGFWVDLSQCDFIASFRDQIATWRDRFTPDNPGNAVKYLNSPYLGRHYEFIEKVEGAAPYLKHIYNLNQSAQLSMGPTGRVSGLKYGVRRLLDGLVGSFVKEDYDYYLEDLMAYNASDMDGHPWVQLPEESIIKKDAK